MECEYEREYEYECEYERERERGYNEKSVGENMRKKSCPCSEINACNVSELKCDFRGTAVWRYKKQKVRIKMRRWNV